MFHSNDQNTLSTIYDSASSSHSNAPLNTFKHSPRSSRPRILWGGLAFLILVLSLVVGGNALGNSPNYFPPPSAQQLPAHMFFWIGLGTLLVLVLLLGVFRRTPLRKPLGWTIGLVLLALVSGACLWGIFVNPYVSMTRTSFLRPSVSINTGQTLHLQNPANGVTQILCLGVDQKCQPEDGAPGVLNHGIRLQPGQSVTITFDTDGDYHITSETTPGINLSVDVSTPDVSGGE